MPVRVISYSYTLNDNEAHPEANGQNSLFEDFSVVLTDSDGDSASDTLSINIVDDVPAVGEQTGITVDEEGLGGNPGGIGDVAGEVTTVNGNLVFVAGADGVSSLSFAALEGAEADFTSGGEAVFYSWMRKPAR